VDEPSPDHATFEDDFAPFISAEDGASDKLDNFEQLAGMMAQLKGLREHASGLDHEERLVFAERIAKTFAAKMGDLPGDA